MNEAEALLADLRSRGIELETDGVRIRWRPAFLVTGPQVERIREHKTGLIRQLGHPVAIARCPACSWWLDSARRCPKCFDRLCVDCGRMTGSYCIQRCVICGNVWRGEGG